MTLGTTEDLTADEVGTKVLAEIEGARTEREIVVDSLLHDGFHDIPNEVVQIGITELP